MGSMAPNHDWSHGDCGGAEHHTKWVMRKEKHSTKMQLVRSTKLMIAWVADYVRCRGSDGVMAMLRVDRLVFPVPGRV
jgi:hypothetical protein